MVLNSNNSPIKLLYVHRPIVYGTGSEGIAADLPGEHMSMYKMSHWIVLWIQSPWHLRKRQHGSDCYYKH